MKYGKLPARPDAVKLRAAAYLDMSKMPAVPAVFGHQALVDSWDVLGNDVHGNCVWAGAGHETMLWNAEGGRTITVTTRNVLDAYAAVTGFDPAEPTTDRGTDMEFAARYRRTTGIVDSDGNRHTVAAYAGLAVGDLDELALAAYLFGAVGIGFAVPAYSERQFHQGRPWDVTTDPDVDDTILGGHYVPVVGRDADGNFLVVTWGRLQPMTPAFYRKYNDESIVYFTDEMLSGGKSPEGFDDNQLRADLKLITDS